MSSTPVERSRRIGTLVALTLLGGLLAVFALTSLRGQEGGRSTLPPVSSPTTGDGETPEGHEHPEDEHEHQLPVLDPKKVNTRLVTLAVPVAMERVLERIPERDSQYISLSSEGEDATLVVFAHSTPPATIERVERALGPGVTHGVATWSAVTFKSPIRAKSPMMGQTNPSARVLTPATQKALDGLLGPSWQVSLGADGLLAVQFSDGEVLPETTQRKVAQVIARECGIEASLVQILPGTSVTNSFE